MLSDPRSTMPKRIVPVKPPQPSGIEWLGARALGVPLIVSTTVETVRESEEISPVLRSAGRRGASVQGPKESDGQKASQQHNTTHLALLARVLACQYGTQTAIVLRMTFMALHSPKAYWPGPTWSLKCHSQRRPPVGFFSQLTRGSVGE